MKFIIILTISIILVSSTIPVFGEASYEILENRFYNQPITCIYEPNVPNARDVIIDAWMDETELGVKNWQYELRATEYNKKVDVGNFLVDNSKLKLLGWNPKISIEDGISKTIESF